MLDFGSGFNIVYTAVAAFFAGLFLVVNILLICRKKYVRRAVDTVFYIVSCILFAAFLLAGLFGIVTKTALFGLHFRPQGTNLFITYGDKALSLAHLGSLYRVFDTAMGWSLWGVVVGLNFLELILHPLKAKKRQKSVLSSQLQSQAESLESVETAAADGEAEEASGFETDTAEPVTAGEPTDKDELITDTDEVVADKEELTDSAEPTAAADTEPRDAEEITEAADAPIILDKKTAAEVMSEIDRLVDFAARTGQDDEPDVDAREEQADSASEEIPLSEAARSEDAEAQIGTQISDESEGEPNRIAAEEENAVAADHTGESEPDRAKTDAPEGRSKEAAGRVYPELRIKTIVRRSIVIPSPYKTAAAGTETAAATDAQEKTQSGQEARPPQRKAPAQSAEKKTEAKQSAEKTGKQGAAKGRSRKKTQSAAVSSARPSDPIEVEAIEIHPAEEPAQAEQTPTGDAKEVRPIETELPVTKRYVILNRRNVVNMFSEYLGSKDKTEQEKLTSSINTIIYK